MVTGNKIENLNSASITPPMLNMIMAEYSSRVPGPYVTPEVINESDAWYFSRPVLAGRAGCMPQGIYLCFSVNSVEVNTRNNLDGSNSYNKNYYLTISGAPELFSLFQSMLTISDDENRTVVNASYKCKYREFAHGASDFIIKEEIQIFLWCYTGVPEFVLPFYLTSNVINDGTDILLYSSYTDKNGQKLSGSPQYKFFTDSVMNIMFTE